MATHAWTTLADSSWPWPRARRRTRCRGCWPRCRGVDRSCGGPREQTCACYAFMLVVDCSRAPVSPATQSGRGIASRRSRDECGRARSRLRIKRRACDAAPKRGRVRAGSMIRREPFANCRTCCLPSLARRSRLAVWSGLLTEARYGKLQLWQACLTSRERAKRSSELGAGRSTAVRARNEHEKPLGRRGTSDLAHVPPTTAAPREEDRTTQQAARPLTRTHAHCEMSPLTEQAKACRILCINTGGTISSEPSPQGFAPVVSSLLWQCSRKTERALTG